MVSNQGETREIISESKPLLDTEIRKGIDEQKDDEVDERVGFILVLISAFAFLGMASTVHYATAYRSISPATMVFLRACTQLFCSLLAIILVGFDSVVRISSANLKIVIGRAIVTAAVIGLEYKAMSMIPIGIVFSIAFLYPQLTILFSHFLLHETTRAREIIFGIISFMGVLFISNPSLKLPDNLPRDYVIGCLLCLLSTPLAAFESIGLRFLGTRVHFLMHVLVLGITTMTLGLIMGGGSLIEFKKDKLCITYGVLTGLFGFFGQVLMSAGFQRCRAGAGSILRVLDVPLGYLAGLMLFGEQPQLLSVLGSIVVVLSTTAVGVDGMKKKRPSLSQVDIV